VNTLVTLYRHQRLNEVLECLLQHVACDGNVSCTDYHEPVIAARQNCIRGKLPVLSLVSGRFFARHPCVVRRRTGVVLPADCRREIWHHQVRYALKFSRDCRNVVTIYSPRTCISTAYHNCIFSWFMRVSSRLLTRVICSLL